MKKTRLSIVAAVSLLSGLTTQNAPAGDLPVAAKIRSDFIGQNYSPRGDIIQIQSVDRTANELIVRGQYRLVSEDRAALALNITTMSSSPQPTLMNPKQTIRITRGSGEFVLVHSNVVAGLPHVSMYAKSHPFATVYFGTEQEAAEEKQAGWITNSIPVTDKSGS